MTPRRLRSQCPDCLDAPEGYKHCHGPCDMVKPLNEFHKDSNSKDGKTGQCQECGRTSVNSYSAKRREEDPLWNRQYFLDYQAAHRDYFNEYQARWLASSSVTAQRNQQNQANWRADHPDQIQAYGAVRRARKTGASVCEVVVRLGVAERDDWTCQAEICYHPDGRAIDPFLTYRNPETGRPDPWYLNVDHAKDLNAGGDHSYANVRATHARCNLKRKRAKRA